MRPAEIAALVDRLCAAGVDFIKDDEVCANPDIAPLSERVPAVMAVIRKWQQRSGRQVMMAFNITDEVDAMRRHADLVAAEGGSCVMASLNWCGLSGMESLRAHTALAIHAHRNGFGAMSRHPALGMGFQPYHALYRLAGIDHACPWHRRQVRRHGGRSDRGHPRLPVAAVRRRPRRPGDAGLFLGSMGRDAASDAGNLAQGSRN
ncbi:MAG: RuBisCO large subunit C-terminal-like domain-containing protein [Paracoccaceae bacterium]